MMLVYFQCILKYFAVLGVCDQKTLDFQKFLILRDHLDKDELLILVRHMTLNYLIEKT